MVFFLSLFIFFVGIVILIPTPEIFPKEQFVSSIQNTIGEETVKEEELEKAYADNRNGDYYFELDLKVKRNSAILLATAAAFLTIVASALLFNHKSHILLPLIAASVSVLIIYSVIWLFTFSVDPKIYINLQEIRNDYSGIRALQLLWPYLSLAAIILLFGNWYGIGENK